jgi:Zn-dependent protease
MLYQASTWVLPVVFAVTFHEAAHGFVAYQFGDDTAQRAGRVTFNPFKHVDTFGTIILPAMLILLRSPFLFGYAKPVPVNFRRLDRPRRDMVWVALAGPGTNVLLAIVSSLLFYGVGLMRPSGWGKIWCTRYRSTRSCAYSICSLCRRWTAEGWRSGCCRMLWHSRWLGSSVTEC